LNQVRVLGRYSGRHLPKSSLGPFPHERKVDPGQPADWDLHRKCITPWPQIGVTKRSLQRGQGRGGYLPGKVPPAGKKERGFACVGIPRPGHQHLKPSPCPAGERGGFDGRKTRIGLRRVTAVGGAKIVGGVVFE